MVQPKCKIRLLKLTFSLLRLNLGHVIVMTISQKVMRVKENYFSLIIYIYIPCHMPKMNKIETPAFFFNIQCGWPPNSWFACYTD